MADISKRANTTVFSLAAIIAALILVNGGFALWQMNEIKKEFYNVANRDLPLISKLFPLIDRQFEQTLLIEKIHKLDMKHKAVLVSTLKGSFMRTGDAFDTTLAHLKSYIAPMLTGQGPELHNEMYRVQQFLNRIAKEHADYQDHVIHLIEAMKHNSDQSYSTIFTLLADEEKDLRRELIGLRDQTQHFTQQSALSVERHEGWMIQGMTIFSLGVFSLGVVLLFLMYRIMKAREKAVTEITHYATYDPLTQLLNRRIFFEQLKAAIHTATRHTQPLSLCVCDLDKFKGVNDTFGHQAGDTILTHFSSILNKSKRTEDIVGRLGGDEFVLFFPNTKAKDAMLLLERIRSEIEQKTFSGQDGRSFSITATFGVAELNHESPDQDDFLDQADKALYIAKDNGRNQAHYIEKSTHHN